MISRRAARLLLPLALASSASARGTPEQIDTFLRGQFWGRNEPGVTVCVHEQLGSRGAYLYLHALCGQYVRRGLGVRLASGESVPLRLTVGRQGQIVRREVPGDGSSYARDLRRLFPWPERLRFTLTSLHRARMGRLEERAERIAQKLLSVPPPRSLNFFHVACSVAVYSAPMTPSDSAIRTRLDTLAGALRHFHSALLDFAKGEYEFLHGPVQGPFALYSLVMNDPSFQWLRPLSGLMATLDEVLDAKDTALTGRNLSDVRQALGLLFADTDTRFADFRTGYTRAKGDARVRETETRWRETLNSLEA